MGKIRQHIESQLEEAIMRAHAGFGTAASNVKCNTDVHWEYGSIYIDDKRLPQTKYYVWSISNLVTPGPNTGYCIFQAVLTWYKEAVGFTLKFGNDNWTKNITIEFNLVDDFLSLFWSVEAGVKEMLRQAFYS